MLEYLLETTAKIKKRISSRVQQLDQKFYEKVLIKFLS